MTLSEIEEATAILGTLLAALSGSNAGGSGAASADLYYAVGDLTANAGTLIRSGIWGSRLAACFDFAVAAGATVPGMDAVRLALAAETPQSVTAVALTNAGVVMALGEEVRILAASTFASRQEIDDALAALVAAFEPAVDYAADTGDSAAYQALIAAQAAAVSDINARAQTLPALVTYAFGRPLTSHVLAQRLYGDASRADELCALNGVIDPQFMPATGVALAE